jgi:hypothetical protein
MLPSESFPKINFIFVYGCVKIGLSPSGTNILTDEAYSHKP